MKSSGFVTLKLDASYRPVGVVEAIEALVMCLLGKATAIEEHDSIINSPNKAFKLPAVIVINKVIKYSFLKTKLNRKNICMRDQNTCQYCSEKLAYQDVTIDHVVPKSRGGKNSWSNLVVSCKKCNQEKGSRTPAEAGLKLIKKPVDPKGINIKFKNYYNDLWKDYMW